MNQPTPAPPAPPPRNPSAFYTDIENIYWQIMGEQPGTAAALAQQWRSFGGRLVFASQAMTDVKESLSGWESPEAKGAYESRSDEATRYLDDAASTALTIGARLYDLSRVMADGQEDMQALYDEYRAAMAEFDSKSDLDQSIMLDQLEYDTGNTYVSDTTTRGRFKAHFDQRAMDLSETIAQTYFGPASGLGNATFSEALPLDYVFHPGGAGLPLLLPGIGPAAPPPPPGTTAPVAPPTSQLNQNAPPGTAETGTAAPAAPPATSPATSPPVAPPGTTAPTEAPPAPPVSPPAALPPGAVITPPGPVAPPGTIGAPPGSLVAPPGTARLSGPAGAQPPPGAQTLGIQSLPPGVPGATPALADPGPPGAGIGLPPGLGGLGLPPGIGTGAPPPPANAKRGNRESTPPGAGVGVPPGMGMPPGTGAGGAPPGNAARNGRVTSPPGGATAPGANVPEAFLPPTGFGPPVLGDPRQQRQRPRPGGPAEAPRTGTPSRIAADIGGGPPILVNKHQTGPRQTHTQRRAAERLAHLERMKRFREMLKSAFAKDLPEGTSPVLEGRPTIVDGAGTARIAEIPPALRGPRSAPERDRQRLSPTRPADRSTRRMVTEQPAVTEAAWEVETPGGPVVASEPRERRRRGPDPGALGGGS